MIIDCISDLHGDYPELEGGDLLIVAGDLTARDDQDGYLHFNLWLAKQKYKRKIVIAGNHDNWLKSGVTVFVNPLRSTNIVPVYGADVTYLCDSGTEFEGLKIWGSPWTKTFKGMNEHCMAFTVDDDSELASKWLLIPKDVDILITHCPPLGILDSIERQYGREHCGSVSLRSFTLDGNHFPNKKLHVFGHIHEHGGTKVDLMSGIFVNASIMDENYDSIHKPVRIILSWTTKN